MHVGYTGNEIMAQAPLLVAKEAGLFDQVGLSGLIIARTPDVLEDVRSGDLDIGVVAASDAFAAVEADPTLQVIAGYRNYTDKADYRGEVLLAAPGFIRSEPTTVGAFLAAYIRALQLFADETGQDQSYDLVDATNLVFRKSRDGWASSLEIYEPFDGGFGSLDDEGGLGELSRHLDEDGATAVDFDAAVAADPLAMTQVRLGLVPNPEHPYAGLPGVSDMSVAMSDPADDAGPISVAADAGYFEDAGFGSVEVVGAEQPLLGVLQGQVDFAVMDTLEVAEATAQGLPLVAIAGHRNYTDSGSYGDDIVVTSRDLIEQEGSTVAAFLIAYIRALQDLSTEEGSASYAPYDGGFGDAAQEGGLGELAAYVGGVAEISADLAQMGDVGPLAYAQAWMGLAPNPVVETALEEGE